mgnify:CR=1 FL=1
MSILTSHRDTIDRDQLAQIGPMPVGHKFDVQIVDSITGEALTTERWTRDAGSEVHSDDMRIALGLPGFVIYLRGRNRDIEGDTHINIVLNPAN